MRRAGRLWRVRGWFGFRFLHVPFLGWFGVSMGQSFSGRVRFSCISFLGASKRGERFNGSQSLDPLLLRANSGSNPDFLGCLSASLKEPLRKTP